MRRYGREKGRELTLPFFWKSDLWGSLFPIGELMKAVHKEMALIGKPMKAARWGPIGVPILVFCYSIG